MADELPSSYEERQALERKINEDGSGCGTIYTGTWYTLEYKPTRDYNMKCIGVNIIIRGKANKHDTITYTVNFEPPTIGSLIFSKLDPRTFQQRLEATIKKAKDVIIEKENHTMAVEETAKKIIKCQLKIDQTIREVAGELPKLNSLDAMDAVAKKFAKER